MDIQTYFSLYEDSYLKVDGVIRHVIPQHKTASDYDEGHRVGGCITFPVRVTTEHSQSSHGNPVLVDDDGTAYSHRDLSFPDWQSMYYGGDLQLFERHADHVEALRDVFSLPTTTKTNDVVFLDGGEVGYGAEVIESGESVDLFPVPGARLVLF